MRSNVLVVGLDNQFVKKIAYELSKKVDMFFLDINDLIEYRISNKESMQALCGIEYYERELRKVVCSALEFENTIINFPYAYVLNMEYFNVIKNSKIIFLNISKQKLECLNRKKNTSNKLTTELLAYEELVEVLQKRSSEIVDVNKCNVEELVNKLQEVLKN